MAKRNLVFATGEIYHIYNRASEKKTIFNNNREYSRFVDLIKFYQSEQSHKFSFYSREQRNDLMHHGGGSPLIKIICYCIMPNHFHLLIKQARDEGITAFMRKIADGYSKYFNTLHHRVGPLFQGNFRAVRIVDNSQLLNVGRYIHLNPLTGYLVKDLISYPWSSYREYIESPNIPEICSKDIILEQFRSSKSYQGFVLDYADYTKQLKTIEHLFLEKDL